MKSRYKGVFAHRGRWRSQFYHAGRRWSLGLYDDERDAALAYDRKAREVLGSDARTNFPRNLSG